MAEERIDFTVVNQQPVPAGVMLTVEYTLETVTLVQIIEWNGTSNLDQILADAAPIRELHRKLEAPPLPDIPSVVGRTGYVTFNTTISE